VDMRSWAEKSLLRPKSIILTQVESFFVNNMKFSGLISLRGELERRNLPVADVIVVEVQKGT